MGADLYTIELNLADQNCLVLGGGSVALRKLKKLYAAGASLEVISLDFSPEMQGFLDSRRINYSRRSYQKEDLQDKFLVITATSDPKLNSRVGRQAREAGILINVADNPELSNFNLLATFTAGLLKIAVSTSGASPALAASIKKRLMQEFGPAYAGYLKFLDKLRPLIIAELSEEKRRDLLRKLGDAEIEELLERGKLEEALKAARSIIPPRLLQQNSGAFSLKEGEINE